MQCLLWLLVPTVTFWRKWDAEIVSVLVTLAAVVWIWLQVGCTTAAPLPVRAPTPGVPSQWYPASWQAPAVLCVNSRPVWAGAWRCA